jgi:hypothetical protein
MFSRVSLKIIKGVLMCDPMPTDFSKLSLHSLFLHCDDLSSDNNYAGRPVIGENLLHYMAMPSNANFNGEACYGDMINRTFHTDLVYFYGIHEWESDIFRKRFKLLESNNKAYELAVKFNPSVTDLEEFSKIDPCFATLFPVKKYLSDHLELAIAYKGMLPFGKEVKAFYNHELPKYWEIKGSPTFKDHVRLRDLSNRKAILMGVPTITVNNLMYQFGRLLQDQVNDYPDNVQP